MDKRIGRRPRFERKTYEVDRPLDELFNVFYHAKVAEGRSPRTLETYRENHKQLCEYMDLFAIEKTASNVTPEMLRSYMAWLMGRRKWDGHPHKSEENMTPGLSPVTVNTRMKTIRTMFRFLAEEEMIPADPCARVKKAAEPEQEIRVMNSDHIRALLAAPDQRTYAGFRDYVAMNVLLDTFGRIGEVLSLKRTDVDLALGTVTFAAENVKTRTGRHVPILKRTARLLTDLIEECEEFDSEFIFLANYGDRITYDQFRRRLKHHAVTAGIDIRIYPHLFRHSAATMFLENGGEIRHLAKILGHKDLRMTMRYTHLSDKSVREQHEKSTPINNIMRKMEKPRKRLR